MVSRYAPESASSRERGGCTSRRAGPGRRARFPSGESPVAEPGRFRIDRLRPRTPQARAPAGRALPTPTSPRRARRRGHRRGRRRRDRSSSRALRRPRGAGRRAGRRCLRLCRSARTGRPAGSAVGEQLERCGLIESSESRESIPPGGARSASVRRRRIDGAAEKERRHLVRGQTRGGREERPPRRRSPEGRRSSSPRPTGTPSGPQLEYPCSPQSGNARREGSGERRENVLPGCRDVVELDVAVRERRRATRLRLSALTPTTCGRAAGQLAYGHGWAGD